MESPAIRTERLTRRYGPVLALDSLSLSVDRGEVMGFLGPNGAGKTTTIRILLDLIRPDGGRATALGFDCQRESMQVRRRTGYLPGDLRLYESLTGGETIDYFSRLRGWAPDPDWLQTLCERLDFDPGKRVSAYSRGNRQKLGLIQALMHRPELLVLDEPTSGLDPLVQHALWETLEEMAAEGTTVFFSSHVISEVERICRRVAFIRSGRLVAVEDIAKVKGRSVHVVEVSFADDVPAEALAVPGVSVLHHEDRTYHLQVRDNLDGALKAIAAHPVVDLRTEQPTLEDIFLAHYGERGTEVSHAATARDGGQDRP